MRSWRRLEGEEAGIDGVVEIAFVPDGSGHEVAGFRERAFVTGDGFQDE
ncbi:hypothetical protein [Paludibaculum fermentans]